MSCKHILSVEQFSKEELAALCRRADYYAAEASTQHQVATGKILTNLFYEPSTRTSSSFYAAMVRLGGSVIPINNVQYSSVAKGESLEDTIRTMQCYSDAIVLRHSMVGAAHRAAAVASVPIINGGDGDGEHPTQALLDFYTVCKELGGLDGSIHVVMMGDLLRGRTVKSLAKLLRIFKVRISWVSPSHLRIPAAYVAEHEVETDDVMSVIGDADVLYLTRVQSERGSNQGPVLPIYKLVRRYVQRRLQRWLMRRSGQAGIGYRQYAGVYGLTADHMQRAKSTMLLMHPLPRLEELPTELDADPRATYFRQMRHGLFMRMAVLADVLT